MLSDIVLKLTPALELLSTPGHGRADWGHLQAGVKWIRTRAKWISCLPLRRGGMCSVSPPILSGFQQMDARVTGTAAGGEMALFISPAASRSLLRVDQLTCAPAYTS